MSIELYRFRYLDPLTGKWREARYRATLEEIAARYQGFELVGEPEVRTPGNVDPFSPFTAQQLADEQHVTNDLNAAMEAHLEEQKVLGQRKP